MVRETVKPRQETHNGNEFKSNFSYSKSSVLSTTPACLAVVNEEALSSKAN